MNLSFLESLIRTPARVFYSLLDSYRQLMTTVLAVVLLLLAAFAVHTLTHPLEWLWRTVGMSTPTTVSDTRTIINRVVPMGELVTARYARAIADSRTEVIVRPGERGFCEQGASYAFVVEVRAGTNLAELEESDISPNEETGGYTISLPQPHLTSCTVHSGYRRYMVKEPVFESNSVGCPDYEQNFSTLGTYQAVEVVREMALTDGILEDAMNANKLTLTSFFAAITDSSVEIIYKDETSEPDRSCTSSIPVGWLPNYDDSNQLFWTPQN